MGLTRWLKPGALAPQEQVERVIVIDPPELLEGTRMSLWNSILPSFYNQFETGVFGDADLASKVWVTNRCQHLNAAQISAMPLQWNGSDGTDEPAWIRSPDPAQFPNGIGDAMYCITDQLYGWGWSLQYVTDFYADGWPRRWTVIPSSACEPRFNDAGRKVYQLNQSDTYLDPARVVQIDRNPTTAAHGTSAIRAYAQVLYGLLGAQNHSTNVTSGGAPKFYLKSDRKLTADQAAALQAQWVARTDTRSSVGRPAGCAAGDHTDRDVVQPVRPGAAREPGVEREDRGDRLRDPVGDPEHGAAGRAHLPEPVVADADVVADRAPHHGEADRGRVLGADAAARPVGQR